MTLRPPGIAAPAYTYRYHDALGMRTREGEEGT